MIELQFNKIQFYLKMLTEKSILLPLVEKFIAVQQSHVQTEEESNIVFKTYLKKDDNNCFTIVDKDHSIKCVFNKEFLAEYLSTRPSYVRLDSFDGKFKILNLGSLILIKKHYFDLLFIKNVNHTFSVRVVLYIFDFECDIVQKTKEKNIAKKNVNSVTSIKNKLKDFIYEYSKVYKHVLIDVHYFRKK